MDEIEFQNEMVIIIKDLKVEIGNVKSLEVELKEVKQHVRSLNKKNEESNKTIIILKIQLEEAKILKNH